MFLFVCVFLQEDKKVLVKAMQDAGVIQSLWCWIKLNQAASSVLKQGPGNLMTAHM